MILLALLIAYIPSANSLLKKTAERAQTLGRTREVTLSGTLTVSGEPARNAQLVFHFPLQCRMQGDGGLALTVKGNAAEGNAGPALQLLQLSCPLLAYRGLAKDEPEGVLKGAALAAGVELNGASSLARLYDRIVYVVGAGARDMARPQLWVYKDNHAPARLISSTGADLRLLEYGNPAAAEWFPRVFELWSSGQLTARFEVSEAKGARGSSSEEEEDDSGQ